MNRAKPIRSMLEAVRIRARMTQMDLARATGISQSEISKLEKQGVTSDDPRLTLLAVALRWPSAALLAPTIAPNPLHQFGRKVPLGVIRAHQAVTMITHARVALLLTGVDDLPTSDDFTDSPDSDPEHLATRLRVEWGLYREPFVDAVALVEEHGIVCVQGDLRHLGVAAVASWPTNERPVMFVDPSATPHAQRRAIAHELGHRLLQGAAPEVGERAAEAFADQFLLPASPVRAAMYLDPPKGVTDQAEHWGVPVVEFARRLRSLGLLTRRGFERYQRDFGDQEVIGAVSAGPQLVRRAVATRRSSGETLERIAESAFISPDRIS